MENQSEFFEEELHEVTSSPVEASQYGSSFSLEIPLQPLFGDELNIDTVSTSNFFFEATVFVPPQSIEYSPPTVNNNRRDNSNDFKKKFKKLLQRDKEANKKWKSYQSTRKCGSGKPCMRIHLNFCVEEGGEVFFNLKREFETMSDNRVGSRPCTCPKVYETLPVFYYMFNTV